MQFLNKVLLLTNVSYSISLIAILFSSHTALCSLLQLLSLNYVPFQHEFCEAENDWVFSDLNLLNPGVSSD